jgi:predicted MFS family arabinose efflux permease
MGGIALLLLACTRLLLPRLPGKTGRASAVALAECVRQYVGFLKAQIPLGALLSSLFASAGTMGFLAFLGVWLHDAFGIAGSKVGLVFLVSGLAALLASPLAGSIADRIGKRLQFVASCVSLALFLSILPGLRWGPALFGVFGVVSLSAAFRQGPMEAILTEIVPSGSRGAFVALKNSFSQLGIGLAAMASGIAFERSGYAAVCFLGAASNLLAAASMLLTFKERRL